MEAQTCSREALKAIAANYFKAVDGPGTKGTGWPSDSNK